MPLSQERVYRKTVNAGDLVSFNVVVKETDLWVSADKNLEKEIRLLKKQIGSEKMKGKIGEDEVSRLRFILAELQGVRAPSQEGSL